MKVIFKRSVTSLLALAVTTFGMTAQGYSNSFGNGDTWIPPCLKSFFIGADGVYLRPQNGDQDYVLVNPMVPTNDFAYKSILPNYKWGWRFFLGVTMVDTNDLTFSWLHFDRGYTRNEMRSLFLSPRWLTHVDSGAPILLDHATGRSTFTLDEAYLVWGHTMHYYPWRFRYGAGVEFVNLFSDLTAIGSQNNIQNNIENIAGYRSESHMEGWGARLEADIAYPFLQYFRWFLNTNAALISGTRKVELDNLALNPDSIYALFDERFNIHKTIFPKFGMKVGLGWDYYISEGVFCRSNWSIEIGWQSDVYMHVIERPVDSIVEFASTAPPFTASSMLKTKVSNFSDQGWFAGLKVDWS